MKAKIIAIPVGGDPRVVEVDASPDGSLQYETMRDLVGGLIERVPLADGIDAWVNEEGTYTCRPNRFVPAVGRDLSAILEAFGSGDPVIIHAGPGRPLAPGECGSHNIYGDFFIAGIAMLRAPDEDFEEPHTVGLTDEQLVRWLQIAQSWELMP
jgi:hypothetical protein